VTVKKKDIRKECNGLEAGEQKMIYYFRIYGRGWFITSSKLIAENKHKQYKELGLARQPIRHKKHWVELD